MELHCNPIRVLVILLSCGGSSADVTRTRLRVWVGSDVTVSCLFAKLSAAVEWSSFTVEWNMVDRSAEKKVLYTLEDGRARVNRARAVVDEGGLLQSNASLQLRNVSVGDEGLYTCRIITPVVYTETTSLEVQARPSVSLPDEAAVPEGQEKTLQCDITGYYPQKVAVAWFIRDGSVAVRAGVSQLSRVCTEMAVHRPDGTYSIRSGITLPSSAVQDGHIHVVCQVDHQTYARPFNRSVRLTLQAPSQHQYSAGTLIAVTSVISVLVTFLVGTLLLRHFCKAPLSVSEIGQSSIVYAQKPTDLQCSIQGATRREVSVKWYKLRSGGGPADPSNSVPLLVGEELSEQARLRSDGKHHTSVLTVGLTVGDDLNTYRCVVQCRGRSFSREATVRVKVEPSSLQISSIPHIPKTDQPLVLCCRVENFYPKDVSLEWSRSDGEQVHSVQHFGPFSDHNHLYSVWSKIQLLIAREDERVVFTCRVYHSSFPAAGYKDILYHINTQGSPPNVMFIDCDPPHPALSEPCVLHVCITDFSPEDVSVTWIKDGQTLSGVFNTPPSLNTNGLYSMFSFLKLFPSRPAEGAEFRCQVVHSAQREPEERVFTLTDSRVIGAGQQS